MRTFVLEGPRQTTLIDGAPYPLLEEPYGAVLEPVVMAPRSSDVNTVYGGGSRKSDNLILGYECIARVRAVASRVRDSQVGDLATVPATTPSWRNVEIQEGNDRHAGRSFSDNVFGWSIPGVFAEAFGIADADTTLAKLPEGVRLEDALVCIDMVMTGFVGVEAAELKFGDTVVVLGIGAVGLVVMQGATLQGTAEIYAVGTREISVRCALEFGAIEMLSYKDGDIREQIMARTGGRGTDAVFVCGGNDDAFREAVDMVRYGIGRVVDLKHYPGDGDIGISKFSDGRGMAGRTVHLEFCRDGRARMERLLRLVKAGRIEPGHMVTHKLEGFPVLTEGLKLMRREPRDLIKMMVRLPPGGEEQ